MTADRKIWNVLIFPAGMENGLEIWKALKDCKEVRLFAGTSRGVNHTEYVYERPLYIPTVFENNWIERLNRIIKSNNIDYIYPANSIVIDSLVENREKISCKVLLPDTAIVKLTRSKRKTIDRLTGKVPVPNLIEVDKNMEYPVFVKPDCGYGSQNATVLFSAVELERFFRDKDINEYVIQEYLPGREFTVDCFSDHEGILFCGARTRERIRMGTSMHSELVQAPLLEQIEGIAGKIYQNIPITGAWFFQLKEDKKGDLKLLEIDIRIAGTMALNRIRGINFPLLTLYLFSGKKIDLLLNNYKVTIDRCLQNRYKHNISYNKVYIDLDDTIVKDNILNLDIIRFLYQCINKKIKLILLSKNLQADKIAYLNRFRIKDIFDQIIWIEEREKKSDYILKFGAEHAIFIDDSFSQRKEVYDELNIPTFDPSMIEVLIEDRYK